MTTHLFLSIVRVTANKRTTTLSVADFLLETAGNNLAGGIKAKVRALIKPMGNVQRRFFPFRGLLHCGMGCREANTCPQSPPEPEEGPTCL